MVNYNYNKCYRGAIAPRAVPYPCNVVIFQLEERVGPYHDVAGRGGRGPGVHRRVRRGGEQVGRRGQALLARRRVDGVQVRVGRAHVARDVVLFLFTKKQPIISM